MTQWNVVIDGHHSLRERTVILNPSPTQLWFYHINRGQIKLLQQMLNEGVIGVNASHSETGETIAHLAVHKNSPRLVNFALQNQANLSLCTLFEHETAFYEASYGYVGLATFCQLFKSLAAHELKKTLLQLNGHERLLVENLCGDERNLPKLVWLQRYFGSTWQDFLKIEEFSTRCQASCARSNAVKIEHFLQGKHALEKKLRKTLSQTKIKSGVINKI